MADRAGTPGSGPRETGKQRAARMPMGYYRRKDRMAWLRTVLVAAVPLSALGWWFGGRLLLGDRARQWSSHGQVADAHAQWEFQCEVCHVPFVSATGERRVPFVSGAGEIGSVADAKCESCHKGPAHHAIARDELVVRCGSCHRDHRGRLTSLVDLPDTDCTNCHANLHDAITAGGDRQEFADKITGFDVDHPDFGVRATTIRDGKAVERLLGRLKDGKFEATEPAEPGDPPPTAFGLKFTHSRHMTPGLGQRFTFARLSSEDAKRYGLGAEVEGATTGPESLVALDCTDCHSMGDTATLRERAAAGSESIAGGNAGAYYQSLNYEAHCAACHPLTVSSSIKGGDPIAVPHGPQPSQLRDYLQKTFAAELLRGDPALADRPIGAEADGPDPKAIEAALKSLLDQPPPAPGVGTTPPLTIGEGLRKIMKQANVTLVETSQSCTECHAYEGSRPGGPSPPDVAAMDAASVWFRHGRFDHAAHRAVRCQDCHGDAYPARDAGPFDPWESQAVMLPSIENCRQCHAPAEYSGAGLTRGGVDFDCTECHRYHNGDQLFAGLGASARGVDARDRRSVDEFVRGLNSGAEPAAANAGSPPR